MKTMCAFVLAMMLAGGLRADLNVETLCVRGEMVVPTPELHVFGGATVDLDVAVEAPLGSKVSLAYTLYQIARNLSAPLGRDIAVPEPVIFEKQTRRNVRIPITLPDVKRRTEVIVWFRAESADGEKNERTGQTRLFIYPQDQTEELAVSLERVQKDAGVSLAVFGESKHIRAFLEQSGIPFTDAGSELPPTLKADALYLGEIDPHALATRRFANARIIFFSPDPALPPGVYTTIRGSGLFTKVTLPILDTLATNPQSQLTFIDILRHSLDASVFTPADSP